jgi:hypothetical protein
MKKLFLSACVAMALVSCKKEDTPLVQPTSSSVSMKEQVAALIQKTDVDLYNAIYINKDSKKPIVTYIPGTYVILQGDVASGTCFQTNSVCFITISDPRSPQIDAGSPAIAAITSNVYEVYPEGYPSKLILNTSPFPVAKTIKSLSATFEQNGNVAVSYKE